MGASLPRYLGLKVHQSILERSYDEITVVGAYSRSRPSTIFQGEKRDKPFNWQRPTARVAGSRLYIECFPGRDHVEHYAEIIATYLGIRHQEGAGLTSPSRVSFCLSSCSDTQAALRATNLGELPRGVETVVLGLVHRLERLTGQTDWRRDGCFDWVVRRFGGRDAAFVGFRPSFWGDIAGEVVHYLGSKLGVREILYFGKLGSVKKGIRPNTWLATGWRSNVGNQIVEWENILDTSISRLARDFTLVGNHITLGSVLHETKDWLATLPNSVDFVDPEVGMMAQASVRAGIRFGYLHIISDNIAEKHEEDLSNERMETVLSRRSRLYDMVQDVVGHHLSKAR
ncbi:hypothetical protein OQA88_6603 [Cercophora sp. LCS_1]